MDENMVDLDMEDDDDMKDMEEDDWYINNFFCNFQFNIYAYNLFILLSF